MARPDTIESKRLASVSALIEHELLSDSGGNSARLSILEHVACWFSGLSPHDYYDVTGYTPEVCPSCDEIDALAAAIDQSGIPRAVALSALARIEQSEADVRKHGVIYTDYRLARYLAEAAMSAYTSGAIIDPSCGSSILLAACAERHQAITGNGHQLVASSLYGVDLEPLAIRASIMSLSSLVEDCRELAQLKSHFLCADSLALGNSLPKAFGLSSFAGVIGNPPWVRVRPSRNEYAREHGMEIKYGGEIQLLPEGYERHRNARRLESAEISNAYRLKGGVDLYRAFLNLSMSLCEIGGFVSLYLPAGLIRSKSLGDARADISNRFGRVEISVFMNRAKFFSIDSRFKFVLASLSEREDGANSKLIDFLYCDANDEAVTVGSTLRMPVQLFCDESGELGAPEVKDRRELSLLEAIWSSSDRMAEHDLFKSIAPVRELDMTLNRSAFERTGKVAEDALPVIEGRMVSQYRCGCKRYLSGEGRSAKWEIVPLGGHCIEPQFYISRDKLSSPIADRAGRMRIGFCDIAGQTNERAMQAAPIPSGCVCGNKVPTILFASAEAAFLWLGIVNSFVFDWVVRRYITTTINFFILKNLPFPRLQIDDAIAAAIIDEVRRLIGLEEGKDGWDTDDSWEYACTRARIDALVLEAYGLSESEFELIVLDFPLVDKTNREASSGAYPTLDLIRYYMTKSGSYKSAAKKAWQEGAMPFVPNEHMRQIKRAAW